MPQEPKKRHSRQRQGKRRAHIELHAPKGVLCPNCAFLTTAHTVCKRCGYYGGKQILVIKQKEAEKTA